MIIIGKERPRSKSGFVWNAVSGAMETSRQAIAPKMMNRKKSSDVGASWKVQGPHQQGQEFQPVAHDCR